MAAKEDFKTVSRCMRFFTQDIWQIRLRQLPRAQYLLFLPMKVVFLAIRGFGKDRCALQASALTFYSLLSIIPVAALALGVTKGFGLGDNLQRMLERKAEKVELAREAAGLDSPTTFTIASLRVASPPDSEDGAVEGKRVPIAEVKDSQIDSVNAEDILFHIEDMAPVPKQSEAIRWIIQQADEFLENTRGGLFTSLGVVGLFWIIIKLLANIEGSFNDIWRVKRGRSLRRKVSDYLSLAILCPILLIISGSLTVLISKEMQSLVGDSVLLGTVSRFFIKLIPYMVAWVLFSLIYIIMPNTRVSFRAAVFGGIAAGTVYQIIQQAYVYFQSYLSTRYDAIFGSLAALPLFLIWLQVSWVVVLFGAEIAFAIDDEETYEPKRDYSNASLRFRKLLALRLTEICVKRFSRGEEPLSDIDLCRLTEAPIPLVQDAMDWLEDAGILARIRKNGQTDNYYQPAQSEENLTIQRILHALEKYGNDSDHIIREGEFDVLTRKLDEMDRMIARSSDNVPVKAL